MRQALCIFYFFVMESSVGGSGRVGQASSSHVYIFLVINVRKNMQRLLSHGLSKTFSW